jgi:RNA polymerase sporulation-specific sigma factor
MGKLLYFALHIEGSGPFPKPLSAKQEKECFELMMQGDNGARDKLIEHNLRLVAHIIKKYYAATNEQEDLISIGTIGLIKAVGTFKFEKGTRFATYASRCIENEILMHFRNIKKTVGDVYINDPIDTDKEGNAITLMDLVSDEESIIDSIDLKLKSELLHKHINSELSPREKIIIEMRYGLHGRNPLTQREVAKKLGISRSYVSRIEKKSLLTLRKKFD